MTLRRRLAAFWMLAMTGFAGLLLSTLIGQGASAQEQIEREDVEACLACHGPDAEEEHAINTAGLSASPHKDLKCQDCHSAITGAPHTMEMLKEKASCGTCHSDQMEQLLKSTHSKKDRARDDHPTCILCHGSGDPHAITAGARWTRQQKVEICSQCHRQSHRMQRYGVDPDAVPSYEESFHGKALLRFGNLQVAICTDCHGHHDVLSPSNPAAPTHPNNAPKTCGQSGCHQGAQVNFAMSGANHLRLAVKESPVLRAEVLFFRTLIFGVVTFLLGNIALDLRKRVFDDGPPPRSGRTVGFFIAMSFLCLVATIILATLEKEGALWAWLASMGLMALAFVSYFLRKRTHPAPPPTNEPFYPRMSRALRVQHGLLAVSITVLMLTGFPLRFPQAEEIRSIHALFGGLAGARIAHRVAAVVLILVWIWHLLWLLVRWHRAGYSFKSWTMWPTKKDFADFIQVTRNYLGLSNEEPKYDRYNFRNKLDYLAEYWGMPIMVASGLILWFPIYFGNQLPELALSVAYIAHGYEATLAFLAIVTWHLYNAHFSPDRFPMSPVWYTGVLPRSEMEHEHPLELARLEGRSEPLETASPARESPLDSDPEPLPPAETGSETPENVVPDSGHGPHREQTSANECHTEQP